MALLVVAVAALLWLLFRSDGADRGGSGADPILIESAGAPQADAPVIPPERAEAVVPGGIAGAANAEAGAASGVLVTGVVRADRVPREDVLITVNGLELRSGLDGLFVLPLPALPATAVFSLPGFTAQEVALSADPMRVDLYSELNLAILVHSDIETREKITGTWRLIRNPVMLNFRRERDPPAPVTVLEGKFESDVVVLLPGQAGSAWFQLAYAVQLETGTRRASGFFGEVSRKFPEDPERAYRACFIQGKQFQPALPVRVRFTDFEYAPLGGRTVYLPTSHALPRNWTTLVTDADGWISLVLENPKLVPHFVIELAPGCYAAGNYGKVEERSPGDFTVLVPTRAPPIVLDGKLPAGATIEIQRVAISDKSKQPEHDSMSGEHEFTDETRILALDPGLDLHGWSSTYGRLLAILMPDRMTLPSVLYQWDDAETVLTLPDLHTLRLDVAGDGPADAKLFLNVRLQDGGTAWRWFLRSEAPIEVRLPPGNHQMTLLVAGTDTELASATCAIPAQSTLRLEIQPAPRLFVRIGAKPLADVALVFGTQSGEMVRARLDADGSALLPGLDPARAHLNLLPQPSRIVTAGEPGPGYLFLGYAVEELSLRAGEAALELPYGFLRVRNASAAAVSATLRRHTLPSGSLTLACPGGASAEYMIPVGEYKLDAAGKSQNFEIVSGQEAAIVLD